MLASLVTGGYLNARWPVLDHLVTGGSSDLLYILNDDAKLNVGSQAKEFAGNQAVVLLCTPLLRHKFSFYFRPGSPCHGDG